MKKTLCFFGIFVGLFITDVTYCESIIATGIGGMQLAQGLYEQDADAKADTQMTAYMQTFHCTYAKGKSVLGGVEEIELPGGNDETLKKLRDEYFALAADLKERKESLGMKPGIESKIILNKADTDIYNNDNVGITTGVYGSLYRAKMGNESDQAKIKDEKEISSERIESGIVAISAGLAIGTNISENSNKIIQDTDGEEVKAGETKQSSVEQAKTTGTEIDADITNTAPPVVQDTRSEEQQADSECESFCKDFPDDAAEIGCKC